MENSKIEWTESTFNPWWGCTKVSPGCASCYAEALDRRYGGDHWGTGKARKRTSTSYWRQPIAWDRAAARDGTRPRVFCASMADWLDPEVPVEWLADLLDLIARTPDLRWMLLTKRPELWRTRVTAAEAHLSRTPMVDLVRGTLLAWLDDTPPRNIWIGATVEDQRRAEERIPALLAIPASARFLSCEPLLSPVDLRAVADDELGAEWDALGTGGIHQVIVGGESGHGARPFDVLWAMDIIAQCRAAGVAVFLKQLGACPVASNANLLDWPDGTDEREWGGTAAGARYHLRDRKGGDWTEWPADLRVREMPAQWTQDVDQ